MVTIIVNNTKCKINNLIDIHVLKEIDLKLSYAVEGFKFMNKNPNWDGRYRLFTKNNYFPIGLLSLVEDVLNKHSLPYKIIDKRPELSYGTPLKINDSVSIRPREYQKKIFNAAIKNGSGIIKSCTGCHRKGQGILMFDGSIKAVEDVEVGDKLMGPDSLPRTVMRLCRGIDKMVKVKPAEGESFVVNEGHILSLKKTRKLASDESDGSIIDVKVSDWKQWTSHNKNLYKLFRVPVDFKKNTELEVDPYSLGLFLGNSSVDITNNLRIALSKLNLAEADSEGKFIPDIYKTSSRNQRLELLAGLMDSCGSLSYNAFDYKSNSIRLASDVAFLARSVGLAAYISKCNKDYTSDGYTDSCYRVDISGDCSIIPNRIGRKKASKRVQNKDVLVTEFTIEDLGYEEYFGFHLDGDHRYLLDDFTVTHNSGKTLVISMITAHYNIKTVIYVIGIELLYQMKDTLNKLYPELKVGMVGDGHCDIQDVTITTIWSAASAFGKKASVNDSDFSLDRKKLSEDKNRLVRKMVSDAEMIIADECQYWATKTTSLIHNQSVSAKHRFLFSGTPWREGGDDILIESVGGKQIYDLNASTLIDMGWLVEPKIYFLDVPIKRGVGSTYQQVYDRFIVKNKYRNELICKAAKRLVSKKRKVLILVTKISHGKIIQELLKDDLRVSSLDGTNKTRERIDAIQDMKDGNLDVLIASKIFDQGIDIPDLDALILAGSGKSSARALQRIGRVIRKGKESKKDAIIVDFLDNCKYLRKHSHARKKIYSTEPSFKIIMPKRKS